MSKQFSRFLVRFEHLRTRYIRHRNFLIFASFIVGLVSGLAAVLLKISVQFAERRVEKMNELMHSNWLSALFPLIGTGISLLLLVRVFKKRLKRGVGFILESIHSGKSRIGKHHILGHILTSAVTVASGGSVGLEAPIVATGAAIGSNAGKDLRLSYKDTTLLLACGTASGIAAIFNSPIAGIIFALEVLLIDFNIPFFIPLLISTATATVLSQVLYPEKFFFMAISGWDLHAIPFYIVLGCLCGVVSVYTTTMVERVEGYFEKRDGPHWRSWLMAGLPLCMLIFIIPGLYGEGYFIITSLLHGKTDVLVNNTFLSGIATPYALIIMCCLLILFKAFSASLTMSAGGNGGVFAPALFIGGITGFLYAYVINITGWWTQLRSANFIIVAMAGVLAGVMHAPLTAIFLLAEITGGYTLFVPLMIVTALSYFITRKYVKHSIYHKNLVHNKILPLDYQQDHF